jgi:hypothetical protein
VLLRLFALLTAVLGVSGCLYCSENEWTYHLSGTVVYDAYTQGPIRIHAVSDRWYGCDGLSQTPGKTIGDTMIAAPGPFTLELNISSNAKTPPQIYLRAFALGTGTDPWACEAGVMANLPPKDQAGITLTLVPGMCASFK